MTTMATEIEGDKPPNMREALKDENYKGEDFQVNTDLEKGPLFNRKCTDILCLLVFFLFLCVYISTVVHAFQNQNLNGLLRPVNGDGKLCGVDELAEYPNLYYLIKAKDKEIRAVCVKQCPDEEKSSVDCFGTSRVSEKDCHNPNFYVGYGTTRVLKRFCIPDPDRLSKEFDDGSYDNIIGSFGLDDVSEIAEDIEEGQYAFVITFVSCIFVTVIYAGLIYSMTGIIVWFSLFGTGIGILALAHMLSHHVRKIKAKKKLAEGEEQNDHTQKLIQLSVYCLYGIFVCYLICLACMWKNIKISIAILKTTSTIVMKNVRILLIPFVEAIMVVGWTFFWLYSFFMLVSTGKITQPTMGSQAKSIEFNAGLKNMLFINVFMYFWMMEFLLAISNYALLASVCTWYFTSSQDTRGTFSIRRGIWWGIRYNMGSLALGSFLLAVVWMIRIVFEYIDSQVNKVKGKDGGCVSCIMSCTRCCIDCFHRFIKFLNAQAYTQMALTGESFCMSAIQAFILSLKHKGTFFVAKGVGKVIQWVGRLFITIVNTGIGYGVISMVPSFKEDIDQPIPFLLLIMLMSFKMADAFMEVYDGCATAIIQSLFTDVDICNQKGKDPMDNATRPKEMNYVVGLLCDLAKTEQKKENEKQLK